MAGPAKQTRIDRRRLSGLEVPEVQNQDLRRSLEAMVEHFRTYEGQGSPRERFVTVDDLVRANLATSVNRGGFAEITGAGSAAGGKGTPGNTFVGLSDTDVVSAQGNWFTRYNGSKWIAFDFNVAPRTVNALWTFEKIITHNADLLVKKGSSFILFDITGDASFSATHDATDVNFEFISTAEMNISGLSERMNLLSGAAFRIYDVGDTDYIEFSHNGTDLNATAFQTANFDFHGLTSGIRIYQSAGNDLISIGHDAVNESFIDFLGQSVHRFRGPTGGRIEFQNGLGSTVLLLRHDVSPLRLELRDGYRWRVQNSADTDWQENYHNGTDFFSGHVNTRYWSITDTTVDIQRVSGQHGLAIGGVTTAPGQALLRFYNTGSVNDRFVWFLSENMGITATQGWFLRTYALNPDPNNSIAWGHTHLGGVDMLTLHQTNGVGITDGTAFSIYDSANAGAGTFSHDGTDFLLDLTNTSDWDISGLTGAVNLEGPEPIFRFTESDATADEGVWEFRANADIFYFRALNDGLGSSSDVFSVSRTLEVIDSFDIQTNLTTTGFITPGSYMQLFSATDAELNDITDAINTDVGKAAGAMLWNSDQGVPVFAQGDTDGALWVDGAGTTINTPV